MTEQELAVDDDGAPVLTACVAEGCEEADDLWLMECAPGNRWMFVNGCGHFGFIYR